MLHAQGGLSNETCSQIFSVPGSLFDTCEVCQGGEHITAQPALSKACGACCQSVSTLEVSHIDFVLVVEGRS